jgi:6-phosphofructokinase 1
VLGGNGSFAGLHQFYKDFNIKFCGIPSTIDNDINGTDYCLGVDTSLNIIKDAIDSIRDTASSSKRAFVIETMGRDCGYLALISALTSGADMCLIPEVKYSLDEYEKRFKTKIKNGKKYILAIIAEGIEQDSREISDWFKNTIGIDSQITILGYIQRGGNPSVYDRLMAYKFINYAIDSLLSGNNENIICYNKHGFNYKSIEDVNKPYELDTDLIKNF